MDSGYIKLWRKTLKSIVWQDQNLFRLWVYCLMKASYKETSELVRYSNVKLEPGQFVFGRHIASQETGLSERTIRTCIKCLKATNKVTIKTTKRFSIVTVINWEAYQSQEKARDQQSDQQSDQEATKRRPRGDHIQEVKNVKNGKKVKNTPSSPAPQNMQKNPLCPHLKIIDLYHGLLPELSKINLWENPYKKYLKDRWSEKVERQNLEWWRTFFIRISESDFLTGKKTDWKATLGWLVKPANFIKIMNDNYKNRVDAPKQPGGYKKDTPDDLMKRNLEQSKRFLERKSNNE